MGAKPAPGENTPAAANGKRNTFDNEPSVRARNAAPAWSEPDDLFLFAGKMLSKVLFYFATDLY